MLCVCVCVYVWSGADDEGIQLALPPVRGRKGGIAKFLSLFFSRKEILLEYIVSVIIQLCVWV
jgi:hypothetical protein